MAEEEKTEQATPKKLEDARKKGDIPQSQDVPILMMLVVTFLAMLSPLGENLVTMVVKVAKESWGGALVRPTNIADLNALIQYIGKELGLVFLPFGLLFMAVACVSLWMQVGFLFTTHKFKLKFDQLNLVKGLKRMVSLDRLYKLIKSVIKLSIYGTIVYLVLKPQLERITALMDAQAIQTAIEALLVLKSVMIYVLLISIVFAVIDVVWVRYRYQKKMKMTKQEVRDEVKQRQGDPKVRAQIRKKQMSMAGQRMVGAVADADVLVTNPTHYAVALQYRPPEISTPHVIAKGRNKLALKMREEARRVGVPIVENPPTAQLLYKLVPVDRDIPEDLYKAVAEVLAYIFRLDPGSRQRWKKAS